jgi:wyosine [tRNA(Phe)-imidazoG37] synthetase (radical SAM superfamily)
MKYLFGPVNSRRLGHSLGIDLLPEKTCNFNCIYCEVGPNQRFTCDRAEYTSTAEILAELESFLAQQTKKLHFDILTITASGEPTLHSGIGEIIRHAKKLTSKPVSVLTNGSLLHLTEVRNELAVADIVIPSLDAAQPGSFKKVNRPAGCVTLESVLTGIKEFRNDFSKELWLEILLVKGINDSTEDLACLKKEVRRIRPDRLQLNTVTRPPLEPWAAPLSPEAMQEAARFLSGSAEALTDFRAATAEPSSQASESDVLSILQRRPCTAQDIAQALNLKPDAASMLLTKLQDAGRTRKTDHDGKEYFRPVK